MSNETKMNHHNNHSERPTRLCHVIKNDKFDGYGFNLHAEKGKPGQYIGKVDEGSPAESAGLRQGDRILEVNGGSIANETHKQVVQRIKALPNETKLLVIDTDEEQQWQMSNDNNVTQSSNVDNNSNASSKSASDATTASANNNCQTPPPPSPSHFEHHDNDEDDGGQHVNSINAVNNTNGNNTNNSHSLNLSMTAAELRAKLAAKKKFDPRKETIDFKKKFDTVQKL